MPEPWVIVLAVCALLAVWMTVDIMYAIRWQMDRSRLAIDGRWDELKVKFRAYVHTWRPMLRLLRRLMVPGVAEADYALHLSMEGRNDEALPYIDAAERKARNRPPILAAVLAGRMQILTGLGRYADSRATAERLRRLPDVQPALLAPEALVELYAGNFDRSLAVAREIIAKRPDDDGSRSVAAFIHSLRGEYREGMAALFFTPSDAADFFKPRDLEMIKGCPEGRQLLELMRREYAGVMQPARHLVAASLAVEERDADAAEYSLDAAREVLGAQPVIVINYHRLRARLAALRGRKDEMESELETMKTLTAPLPHKSVRWENQLAIGCAYLDAGDPARAVVELRAAADMAFHPLEKHVSNARLGQACRAAGRAPEAAAAFKAVAADGLQTRFRPEATS